MTYKPGQKRGAAGTSLGGQFVGPKSIARALIKALSERGHGAAAKDLRQNPPHLSAPKKRAITRWSPSERELKGHARASHDAAQLRGRIATLDEDLKAPQHDGGRMSHPAERRKAELTRAELQRQLAVLEPRVAAGDERRRQHPDMYGDAPHAGAGPDGSDAELASVEAKLAKLVAMPDHQKREAWWDEVDALQERQRAIKRGRELTSVQPHTPPAGTGIAPPTLAEFDDLNSLDIHQQHAYEDLRAQGVGHEQALQRARQQGPTATQATQPHPSPAGVGHQDSRAPGGTGPVPAVPGVGGTGPPAGQAGVAEHAANLRQFNTRAEVEAYLADNPMTGPQLKALADSIDTVSSAGRRSPAELRQAIVNGTGGFREDSAVMLPGGFGTAGAPSTPVVPGAAPKAPRKAAAKVAAAKASAEPPHAIAARLHASTDENEARAMLSGLTVKQLNEVAAAAGLERQSGRKAEIVDRISYQTVGHRVDSAVLRTRGGSTSAAPLVGPRPLPAAAKSAPAKSAAAKVRAAKAPSVPTPVVAPSAPAAPGTAPSVTRYTGTGGVQGKSLYGSEPSGEPPTDPRRAVEVENAVRQSYSRLASRPGALVKLTDLRARLGDRYSRSEVDHALQRMNRTPGTNLSPRADQRLLSGPERTDSIIIGNQDKHDISIYDTTPAPLPDVPGNPVPLSAEHGQFRPVPLPSKEQRDRTILGDKEYERRQAAAAAPPAPGKTAARVVPASHRELSGMSAQEVAQAHADGRLTKARAAERLRQLAQNEANRGAFIGLGDKKARAANPAAAVSDARVAELRRMADEIEAKSARKTAAAKVAQARAAAEPTSSILTRLRAAVTRGDAESILAGMSMADLRGVARAAGISPGRSRAAIIADLVEKAL